MASPNQGGKAGQHLFTARSYITMTLPQQLWGTPKADVYSASLKLTEDTRPPA